ncbi:uncharacterized protein K452DRAFT_260436 [Aplosporella prunicola CBS 121167]|uniref:S-adenosyl-L-methionine-dependent N-methyltransferase n=1 Tax=Aplosporella prunicola CBS 121167 TaxID=1176127 RepID=A0A6A6AWM9_9PEZI|nr:uncharacterized protein K452DRAFT_260436 [Aplosporella prunicola CBS 121167]KAF2135593.1 hypothetical protein K452DRAFT_260436 [Aplosporella prunicola CBS 121167]
MDLPSLIIFGPQTAWPAAEELSRLRTLLNEPYLRPLSEAVQQLPGFWNTLVEAEPLLAQVPGARLLKRLKDWLIYDEPVSRDDTTLNTLVTPMTVLIHSIQYLHYTHSKAPLHGHRRLIESLASSGSQGFCTGFLTAASLACAKSEADFCRLTTISLRIAVCIGAVVDLDGPFASEPGKTSCLAVRWKPETGVPNLEEMMEPWPNAYVSVISDSEAATITAPKADAAALHAHLLATGFSVKEIPLTGRFHIAAHQSSAQTLKKLCLAIEELQLPSAEDLVLPLRSNIDGEVIVSGSLSDIAIDSLLCHQSQWHLTISKAITKLGNQGQSLVLTAGFSECLPRSTHRAPNLKIQPLANGSASDQMPAVSDEAVAIVGMACRFPGADSLEEYWNIIEAGKSMSREFPEDRFSPKSLLRHTGMKGPYWGNFMNDPAVFDHRFFKKSSREAMSMDPQQRLLLQVAYEALEESGYLGKNSNTRDIGCYIGVGSVDYEDNVGSHQPTAFSALGTLRAFVSGKVSHHFGWTGPSVTYDTACSSSAVAIHSACRAIATGECSMALAGGVNVITSPNLYQNLGAASFLSPTGASRAFDAQADGYCRGEGVGAVVLKKLPSAIAEGDNILAVISGSAVGQNENCTPITVPHASSQAELYKKALDRAGIRPEQVTYVEAHGTGTPVGDPIECSSIRQLFGGPQRSHMLHLGSVKGNIGHTEAASGIAALIKVVLMIQRGVIPRQANFKTLNPRIPPLHPDRMAVPATSQEWNASYKVACVNNYGAAGSNASLVVSQLNANQIERKANVPLDSYPIILTAHTTSSFQSRCRSIKNFILRMKYNVPATRLLASTSHTLAAKQNRDLKFTFATKADDLDDLVQKLELCANGATSPLSTPQRKPVVLAFGGQTGKAATLSKQVYDSSAILKKHLDQCDVVFQSMTGKSLYPDIFQASTEQIVSQHGMLFSLQYSCAKAWIECGLQVDAVVGHSFGQLTALCISGVLSLEDGLKFVLGRARCIEELWGNEKGAMLSVEADADTVSKLISLSNTLGHENKVEVACYNATSSHVLVGSEASIQSLEDAIINRRSSLGMIKTKRLDVPRGYHSQFLDSLLPELEALAAQLTFNSPAIPLETCSEGQSWPTVTPRLLAEQSRRPVFFSDAVGRIQERLGACYWLEAGSGSPIIAMTRRALGQSSTTHTFQSLDLAGSKATAALVDSTVGLWNTGNNVHFWPYHGNTALDLPSYQLPPYQFEKSRHWLEYKESFDEGTKLTKPAVKEEPRLLKLVQIESTGRKTATFSVDPQSKEFVLYVSGHAVLGKNLCPASLYIELAARAAELLVKKTDDDSNIPSVQDLEILSPLGIDASRVINLCLSPDERNPRKWTFVLQSHPSAASSQVSKHASGRIELRTPSNTRLSAEFARYARLIGPDRCQALLSSPKAQAMQGSVIYKLFGEIVNYSDYYRGVQSISSQMDEVAGTVSIASEQPGLPRTVSDPIAVDNFIQVAGIHANIMQNNIDGEVLVCTKIEQIQPGPAFRHKEAVTGSWTVYASFAETTGKTMVNDIFVFDNTSKTMVMTITGVHFTRVLTSSLSKVLSKVNASSEREPSIGLEKPATVRSTNRKTYKKEDAPAFIKEPKRTVAPAMPGRSVESEVSAMLSEMADLDPKDITMRATLDDLGIDSLMVTELLAELKKHFSVDLTSGELQSMRDIGSICEYLQSKSGLDSPDLSLSDSESSTDISSVSELEVPRTAKLRANSYPSSTALHAKLSKLVADHLEMDDITGDTKLCDAGLDSLLSMEVSSDIEKAFGVKVDPTSFTPDLTMESLAKIVIPQGEGRQEWDELSTPGTSPLTMTPQEMSDVPIADTNISDSKLPSSPHLSFSSLAAECFNDVRDTYDQFAAETQFLGFRKDVYPRQAELVAAYVIEAFERLGCSLAYAKFGELLPSPSYNPKHSKVVQQYWRLLEESSFVKRQESGIVRTSKAVPSERAAILHERILRDFPQHLSEHKLLNVTGSKLADCLRGTVDPIHLIFGNKDSKVLLEDVYTNAPMFSAGTKLLANFLGRLLTSCSGSECRILELGAGTGGTTKHIVEQLSRKGVPFTYTFSDLSPSLVAAAKRKFSGNSSMKYMVLDVEKAPPTDVLGQYDIVISTNCIHATRDLVNSTTHIRELLKPDGILCLVELTRNLYWFDLVFGLLEGWWLFSDGRKHVLAEESLWQKDLTSAGFAHVDWSVGDSEESDQLRVIMGCASKPSNLEDLPEPTQPGQTTAYPLTETIVFKQAEGISLEADVYYPESIDLVGRKRPIALMIHGGGHIMLSRKDLRPKQIQLMIEKGFLPVSVDYRLCPEVTLQDGPIVDVRDALAWARHTLPTRKLQRPDVTPNGDSVVAVGWSTGGTLAMSLAWTTLERGIKPPEAVLAFYCPTDYESDFWKQPNIPKGSEEAAQMEYDPFEGLQDQPLTAYNVPRNKRAKDGWLCTSDPRSRIALHMNWKGQTLPILINGLNKSDEDRNTAEMPTPDQIKRISPLAQIRKGTYRTPTYLIHPTNDDLIPWQQSQQAYEALRSSGVDAEISLVEGRNHLFDLSRSLDEAAWDVVNSGYEFLRCKVLAGGV